MNWEDLLSHPLPWIVALVGVGIWVGKVNSQSSTFSSFMEEIRTELSRIHSRIDDIFGKLGSSTTRTGSPIQLTDLGQSISETLGAPAWAASHAEMLVDRVIKAPAYDIQALAFQYVEKEFPDDGAEDTAMDALIKQSAYENGLKRKQVLDVLAIELRDCLLRLRQLDPPKESHRG